MPGLQFAVLICSFYCLVFAAPQDGSTYPFNENTIDEESTAPLEGSMGGTGEARSNKITQDSLQETLPAVKEMDSPISSQPTGGGVSKSTDDEQILTPNEETKPVKEEEAASEKPVTQTVTEYSATKKPIEVTTKQAILATTKTSVQVSTVKPLSEDSPVTIPVVTTAVPSTNRYPCRCANGVCSCCTGLLLENFNVPIRSRACANITYEPEDFAFNFKLLYNNRVLYNTRMSAKNPRPACIPINRFFGIKMCARLSNVYMSGRNIHACLDMEGFWDDESAFQYSFNCFRIGSSGVAVVRPEDGGGLPPPPDEEEQTDEDYDDSARGWVGDVVVVKN